MDNDRLTGPVRTYLAVFGAGLLLAVLLAASYGLGTRAGIRKAVLQMESTPKDTVYIRKTITIREPAISAVKPIRVDWVTFSIHAPDSAAFAPNPGDSSLTVPVPIEQAYYRGEDYQAWVSGFRPRLDSLQVFPKILEIRSQAPAQKRAGRVSFGITAGPGVFWDGERIRPGLGAAAGITYSF